MYLGIYSLILSSVLLLNSFAIINERFLRHFGLNKPAYDAPQTPKNRILTLLYGDLKYVLQMPLIWINALLIITELLIG